MKHLWNWFGFGRHATAAMAKSRLQIIIAHQRAEPDPDYLNLLKQEILEVVSRYTKTDMSAVKVDFRRKDNNSILELNVQLPDTVEPVDHE